MPRVRYIDGPTVELEEGESVLGAAERCDVDHRHACGGSARCSTCRVEVIEGTEHCPEPKLEELEVLAINGLKPPLRLACQLQPTGDITVRVLLTESERAGLSLTEGLALEREVAVLFADIRDFTPFAERQLPFDVLHLLTRYFDKMGTVVENHHGHVVSYQGDGMMVLFPAGGDTAAIAAVHCGLGMVAGCRDLSAYSADHFGFELRIGIGIDFGRAVVGQIGYYRQTQLNAIGDVVNTAARVQGLTKEHGAPLLVTQDVRDLLGEAFRVGREIDANLRGKAGRHRIFELLEKA